ncbi:MAG: tetratricopeptide repeat protein [Euryarchaeota archaeon]|nr:tetratricopeptide repeat protein [Euryarchaeota archaeon]
MTTAEEEEILEKHVPGYSELTAWELSEAIKKLDHGLQKVFRASTGRKTQLTMEAEELLRQGRTVQALQLLEMALGLGYFGNEYTYGVLGDVYLKKGDRKKALEMYQKSGSYDSLKKAKNLE